MPAHPELSAAAPLPSPAVADAGSARDLPHPAPEDIRLEGVLHALSDPVRMQVVRELAGSAQERSCSVFDLPVSKSTTTHHFRVLRESGVIRQCYSGTAKMNGLRRDDLEALFPGLLGSLLLAAERQEERQAGLPAS